MIRSRYLAALLVIAAARVQAQDHSAMDHSAMTAKPALLPTLPGQDAYGAIAEVVRILQADPKTNWSKVNIEALRLHLIDMNEVTLRSNVKQVQVPNGLQMTVTGSGRTEGAIQRMTASHGRALAALGIKAVSTQTSGGSIFTVTAADEADAALAAQLRGLGFAGIMTLGNHHAPHHLAIARGEQMDGH